MRSQELRCPLRKFEAFAPTMNGSPTLLHCMGATLPTWLWVQHDEQLTDAGRVKSRQRHKYDGMVWYGPWCAFLLALQTADGMV